MLQSGIPSCQVNTCSVSYHKQHTAFAQVMSTLAVFPIISNMQHSLWLSKLSKRAIR